MFVTERFFVFVAFVVFLAINGKEACFPSNETHHLCYRESGDSFYQECDDVTGTNSVRWLDTNDEEIEPMGPGTRPRSYTEWDHQTLQLIIPTMTKSLSGTYKCVSKDEDRKQYSKTYTVIAFYPLYFVNTNETQFITKGQNSLVICEARGENAPLISMHGPFDNEIVNNEKYELVSNGVLVKNVSQDDAGSYKCAASVPVTGENVDRYINVEVLTAPIIQSIYALPENVVIEGELLSIECKADGFPLPEFVWNKTSEMKESTNTTWRTDINRIIFDSITANDRGNYECLTRNVAGEAKANITIEVLSPPVVTEFKNVTVEEGSEAKVTCKATGRPRPEIVMYFESTADVSIPYDENMTSETETVFNLNFYKANRWHEGFYYCNATNDVESTVEAMYMTVLFKPHFSKPHEFIWAWNGKTVNLNCGVDSRPPANIRWSFQADSNEIPSDEQILLNKILAEKDSESFSINITRKSFFGTYTCKAYNHLGDGSKQIVVKEGFVPALIFDYNLTEITATSAIFNIEETPFVGPHIIGFTAEYDEASNYEITNIHFNRTWANGIQYRIDKLKPATGYKIRFAGVNEVGTGPYSEYIYFETPAKSIPEAPEWDYNGDPVAIPANTVLKLKSPVHNGDPIDYYAVKYCPANNDSECTEERMEPTNQIKLDHLDHNGTYFLELVAHNSMGNSTPARITITIAVAEEPKMEGILSAAALFGISIAVVILCILILDWIMFCIKKQGMIASCYYKKNKKRKEDKVQSRDKKGLLKDNGESTDAMKRPDNGHKEFEYNKTTGVITGRHSAV